MAVPREGAFARLHALYPDVAAAYESLGTAVADAGPLDRRSVALVKLAISVGRNSSRSVHAHARKALEAGVPPGDLRHVAVIALPTLGLPTALDALRWIEEAIEEQED